MNLKAFRGERAKLRLMGVVIARQTGRTWHDESSYSRTGEAFSVRLAGQAERNAQWFNDPVPALYAAYSLANTPAARGAGR